jgi:hypothetical protein
MFRLERRGFELTLTLDVIRRSRMLRRLVKLSWTTRPPEGAVDSGYREREVHSGSFWM